MIVEKEETLISGSRCYSVIGQDEVLRKFIDNLNASLAFEMSDMRVIGGVDAIGRMKIVLSGQFVKSISFEDFRNRFVKPYKLKQDN
ncbi:hypothetical protein [Atlantibacter sp.]|uniref:hypothetical protein n=1 Tax=Atlantibacter sp. TaxID=1903473 RepID=UPI0013EF7464|nr:hypothetical protein [Atlantibacter sp.]